MEHNFTIVGPNFFHTHKKNKPKNIEWSFVPVLIQKNKKTKQTKTKNRQTLLWNRNSVFQAAESAQHPVLDVTRREFRYTTLYWCFAKHLHPLNSFYQRFASQLIKRNGVSLKPSNPLLFGLLKDLVSGTRQKCTESARGLLSFPPAV